MMLRRLKEDVEKNLAAKEETIVEVKHVKNSILDDFQTWVSKLKLMH
jgi:SNF2 family DNA or RNA helicase